MTNMKTMAKRSRRLGGRFLSLSAPLLAAPLLAAMALAPAPAHAAPAQCVGDLSGDSWMWVEVNGVRNSKGLVAITIYPDAISRFLVSKGSLDVVRVPAQAGTTRACVKLPKNGVYAIAVYHDEDGSRKLTKSGLGMPAEGFGFSNNPSTLAGIPNFRSVRLTISKPGLGTRIDLRYP